jgi:hypothetical protein
MRAALRAVIGLVSLVAGVIFFVFVPHTATAIPALSNEALFAVVLLAIWLIFSAASKVRMIADSKATWLGWIALGTWSLFCLVVIAIAFGTTIEPVHFSRADSILNASFFFGWMLIDLFDLVFLHPVPTPN